MVDVYLDVAVAPSENSDDGQTTDDDDLQNQNGRPHDPIESNDAGTVIVTYVASLRTRETFERFFIFINTLRSL